MKPGNADSYCLSIFDAFKTCAGAMIDVARFFVSSSLAIRYTSRALTSSMSATTSSIVLCSSRMSSFFPLRCILDSELSRPSKNPPFNCSFALWSSFSVMPSSKIDAMTLINRLSQLINIVRRSPSVNHESPRRHVRRIIGVDRVRQTTFFSHFLE